MTNAGAPLTPERWRQVEILLDRLLDADAAERAALLQATGREDPALRVHVEALLRAEAAAPAFLEGDAAAFAAPLLPGILTAGSPVEAGRHVGPYRLVRLVGYGGTSVVYLAERADGTFRRRVALKLLRTLGADTEARQRRFRAERQILASLQHANIAQVFDGGVTPHGQPYLAMEYVEGVPITDYCTARQCTVAERIILVEAVCAAVQHAQHRLIVHRDLKPSNVLVTEEGAVKLLDFGIAKLLDPDATGGPLTLPDTQAGAHWMTPAYAAPEQVRGEAVTTATDVYGLGVLLYELLAEKRPYALQGAAPSEVERIVCQVEPPKPSAVAPRARAHTLRGDLDTIVMKALRKEPAARYSTAAELAHDLRRYREGRPVTARPATLGYGAWKFVRRHRWGVTAAAAMLVILAGFVVALALEQRAAARERDRALVEAEKAAQIADSFLDLFQDVHPHEAGASLTANELLDRGVARARGLGAQPVIQARVLYTIGMAYHGLGRYDDARRQMEAALALRRRHLDPDHPDVALSLNQLAWLRLEDYAFADARDRFAEALDVLRRTAPDDVEISNSLHGLGLAHNGLGERDLAESLLREALAMRRRLLGPTHPEVANVLNDLGLVRHGAGDDDTAEALMREALAIRRDVLGSDHLDVARSLSLLAWFRARDGDDEAAEPLYLEALAIRRARLEAQHPLVIENRQHLADLYEARGEPARAAAYRAPAD